MGNLVIAKMTETLPPGTPEELAGPAEAPVRRGMRFASLDVLRGFALLGILILNIENFAGYEALRDFPVGLIKPAFVGWHAHLDFDIVILKWVFAEGKMRGLFSMLFGAGAVLLTERIERRCETGRAAVVFYRRNFWLLLFGICHGFLIWFGDILFPYAVLGLIFLYPLRRLAARKLIIVGLTIWLVGGTFGSLRFFHVADVLRSDAHLTAARAAGSAATPAQLAVIGAAESERKAESASAAEAIREGRLGYVAGWRYGVAHEQSLNKRAFRSLIVLEILGAMITGMGLYKAGFLTNQRPVKEYVRLALGGYAVSTPLVLIGLWHMYRDGFSAAADARWMSIPYTTEVVGAVLANASVLLLLVRSGRLRWVFHPLSAVGRTAFSNYILTSLICKVVFSWGPWKLYGKLEFYQWYLFVAGIWTVNLIISPLWLRVFAFGPLEWLWRSLTYWKRQPLLRFE